MIELCKSLTGLLTNIMIEVLFIKKIIFNMKNLNVLKTAVPRTKRFGMNSIPSSADQMWRNLLNVLKSSQFLILQKWNKKQKLGMQ